MTVIVRFKNVVVGALTLYCMVKVLDPAVRPVKTVVVLAWIGESEPPARVFETAFASLAPTVVAPLTAKLAHPLSPLVPGLTAAVTITIALVPVVNSTDGLVPLPPVHVTA